MQLFSARVIGFQSFSDSKEIKFESGINIIIGQNNAGKSALLRALLPNLADDRHHTPESYVDATLPMPETQMQIAVSGQDIKLAALGFAEIDVPLSTKGLNGIEYLNALFQYDRFVLKVTNRPGGFTSEYPGHGLFDPSTSGSRTFTKISVRNGQFISSPNEFYQGPGDSTPNLIQSVWHRNLFYFSAERMSVGECNYHFAARLESNASNLPAVLLNLRSSRGTIFEKLVQHLRAIFATVGNISVGPKQGNPLEIRIWPTEEMIKPELSFPLNASGTGVSQVIALLTAIMTIDNTVIIIDEINSFLHPSAVKALLRILQTDYSYHQYIISTHAPEVIAFSSPATVHLVKRDGYESTVERLKLDEVEEFRNVAAHLGVSMSDVFAADRIVWVEGPTEELCFPFIYQEAELKQVPRGTIFTSVVSTGDFNTKKRDRKLILDIYRRLSTAAVPLVVSFLFSFDSEKWSDADKAKMRDESRGLIHFLPRRHLECFVIHPHAIATFINGKDKEAAYSVTVEAVRLMLAATADDDIFRIPEWSGSLDDPKWLMRVDAAKLIDRVCCNLTDERVVFNKKGDTLTLLKYVQKNDPSKLSELARYVRGLVESLDSASI